MSLRIIHALIIWLFVSCTKNGEVIPDEGRQPMLPSNENISTLGKLEYTGSIKMNEGPHDLLIVGEDLYTLRDHELQVFSLRNRAIPAFQGKYTLSNTTNKFGRLYSKNNRIYVPCQSDGYLYEFAADLSLIQRYDLGISTFKPHVAMIDNSGKLWVGGSNGSRGILARYIMQGTALYLEAQYVAASNESNMESLVEKDNHIIASIAKGDLLVFEKTNLSLINQLTYQHEAGHEKWGYEILRSGDVLYWANWGAGLATIDISKPAEASVRTVLSNSVFKNKFKDAEGTNVYDVAYNSKHDLLCVANGWSGLLILKPNAPDQVVDFIDPQYFQNRCVETLDDYIYTGNISGGMSGDMKGIKIFRIK